jgi:hypothetical protein
MHRHALTDELLHLPSREHGTRAPRRVLVDHLGQLAALEDARVHGNQFVDDRVAEHRVERAVDVAEGPLILMRMPLWTRRSAMALAAAALWKSCPHSLKARLVVTMVEARW